jgi:hypothetical protein
MDPCGGRTNSCRPATCLRDVMLRMSDEIARSDGGPSMAGRSRSLMVGGSLVRLAYAIGLLVTPDQMSRLRLAPLTPGNPYARMTTRAFGAVHVNVSLLTLRAAILERDTRLALGLNLGCDVGDLIATILEWRGGELPRAAATGSAVVQLTGMSIWGALLRRRCVGDVVSSTSRW